MPHALLIVFGDIDGEHGRIPADTIFQSLLAQNVWFTARVPAKAVDGVYCVFYQSGKGFQATAKISGIEGTTSVDRIRFSGIPLDYYPVKIGLVSVRRFSKPIDPRPLLARLSFVSNKVYWGHSFRYSPRLIPFDDYSIIAKSAKEDKK